MRRLHLFEFEDQPWLPRQIRDGITDFLRNAIRRSRIYDSVAPRLARALSATGDTRVVDLCAGGGGDWELLHRAIPQIAQGQARVTLTDYYPNVAAFQALSAKAPQVFDYRAEPVSAMQVPPELTGFRTLFSSFHHFREPAAAGILRDAVAQRQGIAIVESTQRHPLMLAYMLLTPLLVMLLTLIEGPRTPSRLFWTFVLPVVPLTVMFDGLVSCMRTYTPAELEAMVRQIPGSDAYHWDIGIARVGRLPVGATYLIGWPR